jgi:Ca-activated chloride channel family protein
MKNLFEESRYSLTDGEKQAVWSRIQGATRRSHQRRPVLRPVLATTAVTLAGLAVALVLVHREPSLVQSVQKVRPRSAETAQADRHDESMAVAVADADSESADRRVQKMAAAPADQDAGPTVASSAGDRPDAAARISPPPVLEAGPMRAKTPGRKKGATAAELAPAESTAIVAEPTVRLAGRIIDRATGDPLPFAEVIVDGDSLAVVPVWTGAFSLSELAPGRSHKLRVTHLGYADIETVITVAAGQSLQLEIAMQPQIDETLAALDVEGAWSLAEVKSAVTEQKLAAESFQKYALDSAEKALDKQAGAGRSAPADGAREGTAGGGDQLSRLIGRPNPAAPRWQETEQGLERRWNEDQERAGHDRRWRYRPPCVWIPPNDAAFDAMYFQHYGVNPFIITEEDALSTFAVDVDNASYAITRRYLNEGRLPPAGAVRLEEFVNTFDQGYGEVRKGDFAIRVDGSPSPFGEGYHLLRIGLQGRRVDSEERKPAHLVFVIDISGSMNRENRLGLVKRALHLLLAELTEGDTVGITVYGSRGRVVLEPTAIEERWRIEEAIDGLSPGGSTNAEEGLRLGYAMARETYQARAINRLILCTDGVANQGRTGAEGILAHVRRQSDDGIHLSAIGFGMGNYNDVLLEKLADQGDGNYYYVDALREARRVFQENLTGTLQTIARDVKVQVQFDPDTVLRWRLLGYENRDVADEDFRNDAVDAGEIGAGHVVTALYEVKLRPETGRGLWRDRGREGGEIPLASVSLRYQLPEHVGRRAGRTVEIDRDIFPEDVSGSFSRASQRLQLAAVVAEFAEILRGSYWAKESSLIDLVPMADQLARRLRDDSEVAEFARLVRRAAALQEGER